MKIKNFLLAYYSLKFKFLKRYFSIKTIKKAFFSALLISNFIFLSYFSNFILNFISPFLSIIGIYLFLDFNKKESFYCGFFIGILWFYWISFSLIYYKFIFLIPFEIIIIGIFYGLIFYFSSFFTFPPLRLLFLFLLSHIYPFGFNWFKLELILINGIFKPDTLSLIFILFAISFYKFKKKLFCFIFICLAIQIKNPNINTINFDLDLANTNFNQDDKWNKNLIPKNNKKLIDLILKAISDKKDAILLPESAFALALNLNLDLIKLLEKLSKKIIIIVGGLAYENDKIYNSTYIFNNGKYKRIDKFILVPFGEETPFKNILSHFVDTNDFSKSNMPETFKIKNQDIRNAICYEASRDEIYKNNPKIVFASSNNAWFMPSTMPILQDMLLKYYASKYKTTIYHSINFSPSKIIFPKQTWLANLISIFLSKI